MTVNPLSASPVPGVTQPTANRTERDTFLKLLVTQLSYQDPLSPIQNEEFAAQLAQFSSLEQLQQINSNLSNTSQSSNGMFQSIGNVLASTLIGKTVEAVGNSFMVGDGKAADLAYRLGAAADTVTVTITDASGQRVRQLSLDPQAAGDHRIQWDRRDQNGRVVPDGKYFYSVSASNQGTNVDAMTFIRGLVSGVTYEDGLPRLTVGNQSVMMSDVTRVMETEE